MKFDMQQWEIDGLCKNEDLFDIPSFQRESEIWSLKKKRLFIDTILKGWKIPKIYLNSTEDQKYEIIDGQQRISTIIAFLNNSFKIEPLSNNKFVYYKSLDTGLQTQILKYKIDVEIISDAEEDEIAEIYYRLQQGVALNPAEKLNSITGKLSEFVNEMESHTFFEKTGFRRKRYGIKSICQQLISLENNSDGAKFPALLDFFEKNRNFDDSGVKSHVISTLDYLNSTFNGTEAYLTKSGNVISIYLLCSWALKNKFELTSEQMNSFFSYFYSDFDNKKETVKDFLNFYLTLLQSTTDASSIKVRDEILKRYLYLKEPKLLVNMCDSERTQFYSSIEDIFLEKAEQIRELMKEINERAISGGKHIIFDLTAESAFTFATMPKRLKDEDSYEKFVDLAWKTFYEGSNSANRIDNFQSDRDHTKQIQDINILIKLDDLRKVEVHDLEHDRSTYEKKVKCAAEIRDLYTGKKLVKDFKENDFLVFQYNIINELLDFLKKFNNSLK